MVFVPINYLREMFLSKGIIGFALPSVSLKVMLVFSMCQCLFIIFLILQA